MRLLLAMALGPALVACAPARSPVAPHDGPERPAATLRIAVPSIRPVSGWSTGVWSARLEGGALAVALVREAPAGRLEPAFATRWSPRPGPDGEPCWRFRLRDPRGEEIVADWSARLAAGDPGLLDLLAGVRGLDAVRGGGRPVGLRADGDRLWVCTARDDPMLPRRIAHPAAWPRLDRGAAVADVVAVDAGDPAADARAWFGAPDPDGPVADRAAIPIESWDPVWVLWLNPTARWTADPTFRAWLARSIDREDLAAVTAGGGAAAAHLLIPDPDRPAPEVPDVRPFADGSRPRLVVGFDRRDPIARTIGSRLKARMAEVGIELDLDPVDALPVDAIGRDRSPSAMLFATLPASTDPSLRLLETLAGLGAAGEPFADRLRARPFETGEPRDVRARAVQWELLRSARLVPLVRVETVLAGHLRGFAPVAGGYLDGGTPGGRR